MVENVAVVGAGVTGLATAWFLQEHAVSVTVLERDRVAAGASWGNAGWLLAGDSSPLTHPSALREGLRGLIDPASAFSVRRRFDPALYGFLAQFARHCTSQHWTRAMTALAPLANHALSAYDDLTAGGVPAPSHASSHLAVFDSLHERDSYAKGLQELRTLGLRTDFDVVDAGTAATLNPVVGPAVAGGVVLHDQRFVDPPVFMSALAENVTARGGRVRCGVDVRAIRRAGEAVELLVAGDPPRLERFDAVVVAAGAWLTPLLRGHGVRVRIRAGRGYSFRARTDVEVTDPLYLLGVHVAVTPMRGRLRLAGTMEFARPEDPLDERRIRAIVEKARPLLRDVDLDDREDEWVGPRPVSSDGMPLAGPSSTPGVWCIGGHAMEGMLLGPVTARLLAESVASGTVSGLLRPFDPCR